MYTHNRKFTRFALSSLLGIALTGLVSSGPAFAQKMGSGGQGMGSMDDGRMDTDYNGFRSNMASDTDRNMDRWNTDPETLSYPFAAPGSLHLYHWSDYTHSMLHPGTAEDMRMQNRMDRDKMAHDRMMGQDNMVMSNGMTLGQDDMRRMNWTTDPMPLGYPFATPGSLSLYHWSDYTMSELRPGSAQDARERRMMEHDANNQYKDYTAFRGNRVSNEMHTPMMDEDEADSWNTDPAPLGYPFAAPGSLTLYHWSDYTMSELRPGSAQGARENHNMDHDRRHQHKEK